MKKKLTIGYLFYEKRLGQDEKAFLDVAKKKGINLIMINLDGKLTEDGIKEKIKQCDIFFNNSGEQFAEEIVKTIEELGDKVVDSSRVIQSSDDKWMCFLKCDKHKIPTVRTILLAEDINLAKKQIQEFSPWPVILKRVQGTMGQYVEKADNLREAENIIKHFWKKGSERIPVIAQEFIHSPSYRVMTIGGKIVQTALKTSNGWKATGVYLKQENVKSFKVDKELKKIVNQLNKVFEIKVCGIDLLKKDGKWLVLEINSVPAFDFFLNERKKLIGQVLDFLKKEAKKY
jgi:RimK family alpha-L-glutamate ligase